MFLLLCSFRGLLSSLKNSPKKKVFPHSTTKIPSRWSTLPYQKTEGSSSKHKKQSTKYQALDDRKKWTLETKLQSNL